MFNSNYKKILEKLSGSLLIKKNGCNNEELKEAVLATAGKKTIGKLKKHKPSRAKYKKYVKNTLEPFKNHKMKMQVPPMADAEGR